jgi:hypothetical protein
MAETRKERRKSPRFTVSEPVICNHVNRLTSARTVDISSGGIKIISDSPLRKGDAIGFLLDLEGMHLRFRGNVVHRIRTPDGQTLAGIAFDQSSIISICLLDNYLKRHINTLPIIGEREGSSHMFQSWLKSSRLFFDPSRPSTMA